jgi:hypothetical protein
MAMTRTRIGRVLAGWTLIAGLLAVNAANAQTSELILARSYVRAAGTPVTVTDIFPACDLAGRFTLIVDNNPDGQGAVTAGTIRVNGVEVVHDPDFKQQVPHLERLLSGIAASNQLEVRLGSQPGGTMRVSVGAVQSCGVRITSPTAGASLVSPEILVKGTVSATSSSDMSVVVNGVVAAMSGGQFAAIVPVDSAATSLTATLFDATGATVATHTIAVTVSAELVEPVVRLAAMPVSGIAPLPVNFVLGTAVPTGQIALDLKGTGHVDFQGPTLDGQSFTYGEAGIFTPTVRVIDSAGRTIAATTVVLVEDAHTVTTRFQALWASFRARLQAGDVPGALAHLAPALQPRFRTVFEQLGSALPTIATALTDLHVTEQTGDLAEAVIRQAEASGPALYFLQFRRDGLGRWLIEEM